MKALSIRQPWAWAILHAGKRIENRVWRAAPRYLVGQTFFIHAAAGCTYEEWATAGEFMREVYERRPWDGPTVLPSIANLTRGAIVGRARLVAATPTTMGAHRRTFGQACALCGAPPELPEDLGRRDRPCPNADPWAIPGALGLVLADVEALPHPIPLKGALGFFDVPEGVGHV